MSSVLIPGNAVVNRYQVATEIALPVSNEVFVLLSFRAPSVLPTGSSQNILQSHENQSRGARVYINPVNNALYGLWRTTGNNTNKYLVPVTPDVNYTVVIKVSQSENLVSHWLNGTKISEADVAYSAIIDPAILQPVLQGLATEGSDIEIYELYIGAGAVPTDLEIQNHTIGDDLSVTMPGLTFHAGTLAEGVDGTYAAQLLNVTGSNHFIHEEGDLDNSSGNQPTFISTESPDLTAQSFASTAKTATVGFDSAINTGTAYIVGAVAGTFSGQPDPADIAAGLLDDGTTAATYVDSIDMTGLATGQFIFSDLPADVGLDFYIVQDKDDAGDYSGILHISGATKRPVIVPAGADKRLLDGGEPVVSETGMTMWVLGTEYSQAGYATDSTGLFELDLTEYLNTVGTEDIGDVVDVVLTLSDGERGIVAIGQTITEGD